MAPAVTTAAMAPRMAHATATEPAGVHMTAPSAAVSFPPTVMSLPSVLASSPAAKAKADTVAEGIAVIGIKAGIEAIGVAGHVIALRVGGIGIAVVTVGEVARRRVADAAGQCSDQERKSDAAQEPSHGETPSTCLYGAPPLLTCR